MLNLTGTDAHKFQYALTRQKVEWESEMGYVINRRPGYSEHTTQNLEVNSMTRNIKQATFSIKRPKKQELELKRNVKMQLWSCWKDGICDNDFGSNRHLSPPDRLNNLKQMLVIFEESGPFLIIPCKISDKTASWELLAHNLTVNNGEKRFEDRIQTVAIKAFREFKECKLYRPPDGFPCIEEPSNKDPSKKERFVNDFISQLRYIAPAVPLDHAKFQSPPWQLAADLKRRQPVITFSSEGKTGTIAQNEVPLIIAKFVLQMYAASAKSPSSIASTRTSLHFISDHRAPTPHGSLP